MTRGIRTGPKKGERQEWRTPRQLAACIVEDHGIDLDAAATAHNAIVPRYIGPPLPSHDPGEPSRGPGRPGRVATDALMTDWARFGRRAFCNPPFALAAAFIDAALLALSPGNTSSPLEVAVFLLPCNLDTRWARRAIAFGAEVCPMSGRVRFEPPAGHVVDSHGPAFPTMLLILRREGIVAAGGAASTFAGRLISPLTGRPIT